MPIVTFAGCAASLVVAMGLAGCAMTAPHKPVSGATFQSEVAMMEPKLSACDELACYHGKLRYFHVRDIRCPEDPVRPTVCEYERAETDNPFPKLRLEAKPRPGMAKAGRAEVALPWQAARSVMYHAEGGLWRIVADTAE
ncbi:hypothetical protein AB2M62_18725 [Sphingomonas sp. MMS12-HWE2-04]|uniref:hypothetical protein n=1 Tax=Sphingomonas sp. MMS12-HWE2-04 TaxID=3234199 RepID=UPI00384A7D0D